MWGIKQCPIDDCLYVAAISQSCACPEHTEAELVVSKDCPVEFVYVWPEDSKDKRQWLSGVVRVGNLKSRNLHSHLINGPTKVPFKLVQDIQSAMKLDPSLKTHDIITGTIPCNTVGLS